MGQVTHSERVISPGWFVSVAAPSVRAAMLKQKNMPLIHAALGRKVPASGMDIEIKQWQTNLSPSLTS